MLMKCFSAKRGGSPEARAKRALCIGLGGLALGIMGFASLIFLEVLRLYPLAERVNPYANGLLFGISGGMLGSGFSTAFTAWQRLRDPEKMRKFEIKAKDERNQAIRGAAAKMTLVTSLVVLYLLILASAFVYPAVSFALSMTVCALFAVYFLFLCFYSRQM